MDAESRTELRDSLNEFVMNNNSIFFKIRDSYKKLRKDPNSDNYIFIFLRNYYNFGQALISLVNDFMFLTMTSMVRVK